MSPWVDTPMPKAIMFMGFSFRKANKWTDPIFFERERERKLKQFSLSFPGFLEGNCPELEILKC